MIYVKQDNKLLNALQINVRCITQIHKSIKSYIKYDITIPKENIDAFKKVLDSTSKILDKFEEVS